MIRISHATAVLSLLAGCAPAAPLPRRGKRVFVVMLEAGHGAGGALHRTASRLAGELVIRGRAPHATLHG